MTNLSVYWQHIVRIEGGLSSKWRADMETGVDSLIWRQEKIHWYGERGRFFSLWAYVESEKGFICVFISLAIWCRFRWDHPSFSSRKDIHVAGFSSTLHVHVRRETFHETHDLLHDFSSLMKKRSLSLLPIYREIYISMYVRIALWSILHTDNCIWMSVHFRSLRYPEKYV